VSHERTAASLEIPNIHLRHLEDDLRKLGFGVAALVVAVILGLGLAPGSARASGIILQQKYGRSYITSSGPTWANIDLVATVDDTTADRARAYLGNQGVPNGLNQLWVGYSLQGYPSDEVVFINQNSGKCLDKSMDNGNNNGAAVYQYSCSYAANQLWRLVQYTSTSGWTQYHIVSVASGQCLDVTNFVYANGTPLQVWGCNSSGWNQGWHLYAG
jgi:hypothetical protein